jgi:uncharacterized protein YndB with AHSA1/START domain
MWFDVDAVPLSFTQSSPFRFENTVLIDATPARVFQILATAEAQPEWFQDFIACRWSTTKRGVGAEREMQLERVSVKERFLAWDQDRRLAFHVFAVSFPFVKAMIEDMVLEPVGDRATRLLWRVHYTPTLPMRVVHPLARRMFGAMFKTSAEGLARYAKAHPG